MKKTSFFLLLVLVFCLCVSVSAEQTGGLTGVNVRDTAKTAILSSDFDPTVADYWVYVQGDTYGIEFTPTGADVVINGAAVADGEAFVYELPQEQETHYDTWFGNVEITCGDVVYNYKVVREDPGSYTTDAFKLNTWKLPDGKEMYYWLYLPENYDSSREYPVVLYLHGGGQRSQHVDQVLLANTGAGAFVKYQHDAIVIAPQSNYTDLSSSTPWATDEGLTIFGDGAYDILQAVKKEYNIDEDREYVTGLSMGGGGSYGMIMDHPTEFAAAIANCGGYPDGMPGWEKVLAKAVKEGGTKLMLAHATGDPKVNFTNFQEVTAALNREGATYCTRVYSPDDFLWPNRHWCWAITYADEDCLNWLMNQSRSAGENELIDLRVDEGTLKETIAFNPEKAVYEMNVQYDIYGVRITPYGKGSFTINGTEVKGGEGYILPMSEVHGDYAKTLEYVITVKDANETYTVKVIRENNEKLLEAFELKQWTLDDGREMNYWLHIPEDYDASKSYPVLLSLHGSGQRYQDPKMILQRYVNAYAPVKHGYDCIVIAPQCNYTDLSNECTLSWCDDYSVPTLFGKAAYDILQSVKSEYNVNQDKIYVAGLSNGGRGTQAMVTFYPDEFAAACVIAAFQVVSDEQWETVVDAGIPIWFGVHISDGAPANGTIRNSNSLINQGYEKLKMTVFPSNIKLFPSAHFSQIPFYADSDVLEWLFAQSK